VSADADIAIVGAGIVGLSTAYALTEAGAAVTVYERGVPGNGQSGGESRIFRHAHDDRRLVDFACEARRGWREWEERFGRELLSRDGVVSLGAAGLRQLDAMRGAGVRAGQIDHAELADRLPLLAEPDARAAFDEDGYGDPLPGNAAYAVGVEDTPIHDDGSVIDAGGLAAIAARTTAYVERALPGLDPRPIDVRHCWVTELPWSPDGFAVWELGGVLILAGNHLFKHAPALGRALARAALGDGLEPSLHPEARLGAELFETSRP